MDVFDNPMADSSRRKAAASVVPASTPETIDQLQEKCVKIGVSEHHIANALANADVGESLRDLISGRTVQHHYREWAIVCSHDTRLGADRATGEPEVMVRELMDRLRQLGLQVDGHPNPHQTAYVLQVSASEETLLFWATKMGLLMRLKGDPSKNRRHAEFGGSKSSVSPACAPVCR